jgi:Cys-tRNA(Pro)/Cys-tRNA(Cys) deacylase
MSAARTPAIAAAQRAGVDHRVHEYAHDPRSESYGLEAAEKLGVDADRVFKTLVVEIDGALAAAVLPVGTELDLRSLGKRASLAAQRDAERAAGYVTGGISPIGQRKQLPTILDESAGSLDTIFVSAGRRGLEIELAPDDLLRLTGGRIARIASRSA